MGVDFYLQNVSNLRNFDDEKCALLASLSQIYSYRIVSEPIPLVTGMTVGFATDYI